MLIELHIQHFVLIDQLHLELPSGLNVITGETGAGKSLTLAAIGLLLGERSQAHLVAAGTAQADISARFDISQLPAAREWLISQDHLSGTEDPLTFEEPLTLRRVIKPDGKSRAYLNDQPCSIGTLKALGQRLVSFTSQHQQQQLGEASRLLKQIDAFGGHSLLTEQTELALTAYQQQQKYLAQQRAKLAATEQRRQLILYQLEEIMPWSAEAEQISELHKQHQQLSHAEHNHTLLKQLMSLFGTQSFSTQAHSISQQLHQAERLMQQLQLDHPAKQEAQQFLQQMQIFAEETLGCAHTLDQLCEVEPQRLDKLNTTLTQLHKLAKKHQIEPQQLPAKQQALQEELDQSVQLAAKIAELEHTLQQQHQQLLQLSQQLQEKRTAAGAALNTQLTQMVQELGMPHFRSRFVFGDGNEPDSLHQAQWLIATHQQAEWQPLRQVASGGELSRITLAMSSLCRGLQQNDHPLMVFDEIDTGVSGKIAERIAEHLAELAKAQQILCVTHSAQVAARADQHFLAEKHSTSTHSYSRLQGLTREQRAQELARMIGGEQTQSQSLVYAKALLKSQQKIAAAETCD